MDHDFQFRIFRPEKQDYHFRCFVALKNFPRNDTKSRVPFSFQPDFLEFFVNGKQVNLNFSNN